MRGEKYKREDKLRFLEVLKKKGLHKAKACEAFGMSRTTLMKWEKEDEWYRGKYQELLEEEMDNTEEMIKTLIRGIPEKNKKGEIIGWILKPSERLLVYYANNILRKRGYGERIEVTGNITGKITVDFREAE